LDKSLQIESGYRKSVTDKYFSDLKQTEFANAESAVSDINSWVLEKTNQRINKIVDVGHINPNTQILISNVVYFKKEWLNKFEKQKTISAPFFTSVEDQYNVDFMKMTERLQYFENEEYQFISKPYSDSDLSFCIILPKKLFGIEEIEEMMNHDFLKEIFDSTYYTETSLSIPKLKLESSYELSNALKNAGLKSAFTSEADFSGITKEAPLMLGQVLHKTWIELDEEKTEAAAATAVTFMVRGVPSYKIFTADHPFIFFIINNRTGAILFMGRYVKPVVGDKITDTASLNRNMEVRKKTKTSAGSNSRILYVMDKKIISRAEFEAIIPEDIEKFKVLKDEEKIRKYTSGNYDGVIVITLKKNRELKK
jgi:serpin B